jgi:hypothetical protein
MSKQGKGIIPGRRLRLISTFLTVCAALASLVTARADEQQEFHCPKPGTVIEYTSTGGTVVFGEADGMWCTGTQEDGQSWRRYAMLAGADASWSGFIENHVERIWPLQLGKEINFTFQGRSSRNASAVDSATPFWYVEKIVVARKEKLTVPAGTFDTWVIEDHQEVSRGRVIALRTYWYAPEVGFAIKYSYHITQGIGKDIFFEAKSIR